jgi:hypothetical protein
MICDEGFPYHLLFASTAKEIKYFLRILFNLIMCNPID